MNNRRLTTLEAARMIDSLQAVLQQGRPIGCPPGEGQKAINWIVSLGSGVTRVIVKLQAQFAEHFKPAVAPVILARGFIGAKYKNESADFRLTADEWRIVDQWNGKYSIHDFAGDIVP